MKTYSLKSSRGILLVVLAMGLLPLVSYGQSGIFRSLRNVPKIALIVPVVNSIQQSNQLAIKAIPEIPHISIPSLQANLPAPDQLTLNISDHLQQLRSNLDITILESALAQNNSMLINSDDETTAINDLESGTPEIPEIE